MADRDGERAARARALLRCPRCGSELERLRCASCGASAALAGSVVDFLGGDRAGHAPEVMGFYERHPFPGYAAGDDAGQIVDRGRRSPFLAALDAALPTSATVLDVGCGTAQVAAFLALSARSRTVVALDGCRASLAAADAFKERAQVANLALVRGDLFALPLARRAFEFVLCRGVVHHTGRPWDAIAEVAERVAPGGFLVLGFYERWARGPHVARRALFRVAGRKAIAPLDPVLRRRDLDPEKKRIWIEDQYRHPLDVTLSLSEVARFLERAGLQWVRSVPPAVGDGAKLFDATARPSGIGLLARGLGLSAHGLGDEDAGLVCVVAARA